MKFHGSPVENSIRNVCRGSKLFLSFSQSVHVYFSTLMYHRPPPQSVARLKLLVYNNVVASDSGKSVLVACCCSCSAVVVAQTNTPNSTLLHSSNSLRTNTIQIKSYTSRVNYISVKLGFFFCINNV